MTLFPVCVDSFTGAFWMVPEGTVGKIFIVLLLQPEVALMQERKIKSGEARRQDIL